MHSHPITQGGYNKLVAEYEFLVKTKLPESSKRIGEALSHGDLKENAEYHAALEYQNYIQKRIEYLRQKITGSQIITVSTSQSDVIVFGRRVKTLDLEDNLEEEFTLVGAAEAEPATGKISTASPIGKNLLGKKINDVVEIKTPGGILRLKILAIT
jgi:transcription elongation factor GreA